MSDKKHFREMRPRIQRILLEQWDPIGIKDEPNAQDEYDSYVGGIYKLIVAGASEEEIAEHLLRIEYERMELPHHPRELVMPAVRSLRAIKIT